MSRDGVPEGVPVVPTRVALTVALVAVRVLVVILVIVGAERRPVTDVQVVQAERVASSPATPYRTFPVSTMPLETLTERVLGGSGAAATAVRIAILAFLADLAAAAALAWGWGRRPAIVYLLVGLPLLSFIYLRFDLVSVALATWAIAWIERRDDALGGAALGAAVMAKLWPLVLLPTMWTYRASRSAMSGCAAAVVAVGAWWYLTGGPKGPFQVLSLGGVRGWHVQSTVGSVLWLGGRGVAFTEANALRIDHVAVWMKAALLLALLACEIAIWGRAARPDRDPAGGAALAAVVALTVFSPQFTVQYAAWFLPWTALAFEGDDDEVRTAVVASVAIALTGVLAVTWPDPLAVPGAGVKLLVLARNVAAIGVLVSWFASGRARTPQGDDVRVAA